MKREPIFQTVRNILGRGFRPAEVAQIDAAVDCATGETTACDELESGTTPTRIGHAGTALIKEFEGCARLRRDGLVEAYPDPGTGGDPWTIGWGATGRGLNGQPIGLGTVWTQQQCDARLERDLMRYADDVVRALDSALTSQAQFDALVSFHYNTGAIARATLTRHHKARDYAAAFKEFARWNRAGGRVMKGLTRRRLAEAKLYGAAA